MPTQTLQVGATVYLRGSIWGHRVTSVHYDPGASLGRPDLPPGVQVVPASDKLPHEIAAPGTRGFVPLENLS